MRASIALFALCAAMVGTHALPTPDHGPLGLVHLGRRAPGDDKKNPLSQSQPGSTGSQTTTTTKTNPLSQSAPGTKKAKGKKYIPIEPVGGSHYSPFFDAVNAPKFNVGHVWRDDNSGSSSDYEGMPTNSIKISEPGSGTPRTGSGTPGTGSGTPRTGSGTTGTNSGTTGTNSGAPGTNSGAPGATPPPPQQTEAYLDETWFPLPLPTAEELRAAGFGTTIEGDGNSGFADYAYVRKLGRGSFSSVFLLYKDKQFRALKLQGPEFSYRPEEYAIQKKLTDAGVANVVKVFEQVDEDNRKGFIMEAANGGTLEDLAKQATTGIKESLAKTIFEQLVQGLKAMHDLNVVNRDIKPGNVLLFLEGTKTTAKYSDFGLAGAASDPYPSVFWWGGSPLHGSL